MTEEQVIRYAAAKASIAILQVLREHNLDLPMSTHNAVVGTIQQSIKNNATRLQRRKADR